MSKTATKSVAKKAKAVQVASAAAAPRILPPAGPPAEGFIEAESIAIRSILRDDRNHRLPRPGDEERIRGFAESMRIHGVLQPVILFRSPDPKVVKPYYAVFGFRRIAAAELAGLTHIPAFIRPMPLLADGTPDYAVVETLRAVENVDRQDLSPTEEALGVAQLISGLEKRVESADAAAGVAMLSPYNNSYEAWAAALLGRPTSWVRDRAYLARLSPKVQKLITDGKLDLGPAREIAKLGDEHDQNFFANECSRNADGVVRMGMDQLKRLVAERMRSLRLVPWKLEADMKGPKIVGPCVGCP